MPLEVLSSTKKALLGKDRSQISKFLESVTSSTDGGGREFDVTSSTKLGRFLRRRFGIPRGITRNLVQNAGSSDEFISQIYGLEGITEKIIPKFALRSIYLSSHSSIGRKVVPVVVTGNKVTVEAPLSGEQIVNKQSARRETPIRSRTFADQQLGEDLHYVHGPWRTVEDGGFVEEHNLDLPKTYVSLVEAGWVPLVPVSDHKIIPIIPVNTNFAIGDIISPWTSKLVDVYRLGLLAKAIRRSPDWSELFEMTKEGVFWKGKEGYPLPDEWIADPQTGQVSWGGKNRKPAVEGTYLRAMEKLHGPEFLTISAEEVAKRSSLPFTTARDLDKHVLQRVWDKPIRAIILPDERRGSYKSIEDGVTWVSKDLMTAIRESGGIDDWVAKTIGVWSEKQKFLFLKHSLQIGSREKLQGYDMVIPESAAKRHTGIPMNEPFDLPIEALRVVNDTEPYRTRVKFSRQLWHQLHDAIGLEKLTSLIIDPAMKRVQKKLKAVEGDPSIISEFFKDHDFVSLAPHPAKWDLQDAALRSWLLGDIMNLPVPGVMSVLRPNIGKGLQAEEILVPHTFRKFIPGAKGKNRKEINTLLQEKEMFVLAYRSPVSKPDGFLRLRVKGILPKKYGGSTVLHEKMVFDRLEGDYDIDKVFIMPENRFGENRNQTLPDDYLKYVSENTKNGFIGSLGQDIEYLVEKYARTGKRSIADVRHAIETWQDFRSGKDAIGLIANIQHILAKMRINNWGVYRSGDVVRMGKLEPGDVEVVTPVGEWSSDRYYRAKRKIAIYMQLAVDNPKYGLLGKMKFDRVSFFNDILSDRNPFDIPSLQQRTYHVPDKALASLAQQSGNMKKAIESMKVAIEKQDIGDRLNWFPENIREMVKNLVQDVIDKKQGPWVLNYPKEQIPEIGIPSVKALLSKKEVDNVEIPVLWSNALYPGSVGPGSAKGITGFFHQLQRLQKYTAPSIWPIDRMFQGLDMTYPFPVVPEEINGKTTGYMTHTLEPFRKAHTELMERILTIEPDGKTWKSYALWEKDFAKRITKEEQKAFQEMKVVLSSLKGRVDDDLYEDLALGEMEKVPDHLRWNVQRLWLKQYYDDPARLDITPLTTDLRHAIQTLYQSIVKETYPEWVKGLPLDYRPGFQATYSVDPFGLLLLPQAVDRLQISLSELRKGIKGFSERTVETVNEWEGRVLSQKSGEVIDHLESLPKEFLMGGTVQDLLESFVLVGGKRNLEKFPLTTYEMKELLEWGQRIDSLAQNRKASGGWLTMAEMEAGKSVGSRKFYHDVADATKHARGLRAYFTNEFAPLSMLTKEQGVQLAKLADDFFPEKTPVDPEVEQLYRRLWIDQHGDRLAKIDAHYPELARKPTVMNKLYWYMYKTWSSVGPDLQEQLGRNKAFFAHTFRKIALSSKAYSHYQEMSPEKKVEVDRNLLKRSIALWQNKQKREKFIKAITSHERVMPYVDRYYPRLLKRDDKDFIAEMQTWHENPYHIDLSFFPSIMGRMLTRTAKHWRNPKYYESPVEDLTMYANAVVGWIYRERVKKSYRQATKLFLYAKRTLPRENLENLKSMRRWTKNLAEDILMIHPEEETVGRELSRLFNNAAIGTMGILSTIRNRIGGAALSAVWNGASSTAKARNLGRHDSNLIDPLTGMTVGRLKSLLGIQFLGVGGPEGEGRFSPTEIYRQASLEKAGPTTKFVGKAADLAERMAQFNLKLFGFTRSEEAWRLNSGLAGYLKEVEYQRKVGRYPGETKEQYRIRVEGTSLQAARKAVDIVMGDFSITAFPEKFRKSPLIRTLAVLRKWNIIYLNNIKKIMYDDPKMLGFTPEVVRRMVSLGMLQAILTGSTLLSGWNIAGFIGDDIAEGFVKLGRLLSGDEDIDLDDLDDIASFVGGRVFGPTLQLLMAAEHGNTADMTRAAESLGRLGFEPIIPAIPSAWPLIKRTHQVLEGDLRLDTAIVRSLGIYPLFGNRKTITGRETTPREEQQESRRRRRRQQYNWAINQ